MTEDADLAGETREELAAMNAGTVLDRSRRAVAASSESSAGHSLGDRFHFTDDVPAGVVDLPVVPEAGGDRERALRDAGDEALEGVG